jgi:anthranilate phosphoribosyltransferase
MIKESIQKVVEGVNLTREEAAQIMKEIMRGEASDAQIAAFITALRMKAHLAQRYPHGLRIR